MIDHPGDLVLGPAEEPLIEAMSDVEGEAMLAVRAELIAENWDPYKVQARNIEYLRWALGVSLWEESWPESAKREWMGIQWEFKARRGTLRAYEMALERFGFTIQQVVAPPQGFFASPDMTKAEYDAWIRLMPQVRIFLGSTPGNFYDNEFFACDDLTPWGSFADEDVPAYDDAALLVGRRAVLRRNGIDTPLKTGTYVETMETGEVSYLEEVYVPGENRASLFADDGFADEDFADTTEDEPQILTVNRNLAYEHTTSTLSLTVLKPGLEPIDPRYERESDIGVAGPFFYADDGGAEVDSAGEDDAALMLADVLYLLDPDVATPMTTGWSFADVDRVGMPTYTAELMIDLHQTDEAPATYADIDTWADFSFAIDEDDTAREQAFRAVLASKALRDTVLVRFDPFRPWEFGDPVSEATTFGTWVKADL